MATLDEIRRGSTWGQILEGQAQHVLIGGLLVVGASTLLIGNAHPPRVLGMTSIGWAMLSIWLAVAHQVLVAVVFRLQLHKALLTRLFGAKDLAAWTAVFMPFLAARPLTILLAGLADTRSLPIPVWAAIAIGVALLVPASWALWSTVRFFTLPRAVGGDHFREAIRALPKVRGGVFDHTDNGMYGVAFLGLWAIACLTNSWNALIVAAFQQAYIWLHMYVTEAPDLRRLHGAPPAS